MLNNRFVSNDRPSAHTGLLVATDEELDAIEGGLPSAEGVAFGATVALVGGLLIGGPFGLCFAAGALCGIFT